MNHLSQTLANCVGVFLKSSALNKKIPKKQQPETATNQKKQTYTEKAGFKRIQLSIFFINITALIIPTYVILSIIYLSGWVRLPRIICYPFVCPISSWI